MIGTERPPLTATDITVNLILEMAEKYGIRLIRETYYDNEFPGNGMWKDGPCGCAIAVAAIAIQPKLAEREYFYSETVSKVLPGFCGKDEWSFENGIEEGFMGNALDYNDADEFPDFARGHAVGCEIARRAGLEMYGYAVDEIPSDSQPPITN